MNSRVTFHVLAALVSLVLGIVIFLYGNSWPWVRYYAGDFVIVIFLYAILRLFVPGIKVIYAAILVWIFSTSIELLQWLGLPQYLQWEHWLSELIIGSHFEVMDIVLYTLGLIFIIMLEKRCVA